MAEWRPLDGIHELSFLLSKETLAAPVEKSQDDYESFLSEIQAAETEAATPPPEERSFIDDDGTLYKWDSKLRKFMPEESVDVASAYNLDDMVFKPDEEQLTVEEEDVDPVRKRKAALEAAAETAKRARTKQGWFNLKKNTSVYITGLPDDVETLEVYDVFSKCGIIKEDEDQLPRIKIYKDSETGVPKGDGLVTYLKEPSVELAIKLLDGIPLRYGLETNMTVKRAQFEQKGGSFVSKKVDKSTRKKKAAVQEKALEWDGFDDTVEVHKRTVILKNIFSPEDFLLDINAKVELEMDIMTEAVKFGKVEKLKVHKRNVEGAVSIEFQTEQAADECVRGMNGRWFGGRQLQAGKWDGITNYNTKRHMETEEEQGARLEAFANDIEKSKNQ